MSQASRAKQITDDLLRPLLRTTWKFYIGVSFLSCFVLAGLAAWGYQMYNGLAVTGDNWPVFWGFHETNFVFWIGISHAGTLISAILRMVYAEWRRPVTRCAEAITAFALTIGAMFPLVHLGRPWFAWWLIPYPSERGIWPNFRSPLTWDFFAINTYLTSSLLFLFLPMIPDFAIVRDRTTGLRKRIYGFLALGWQGYPKQWHRLELAMHIMAIAIIPIAVSVHTIVSFDFSMALVPMWHTTIFGPYFVAGAIFSGIAALIIAMAVLRKVLHLEEYLLPIHFNNLGKLLFTMSLLWGYFVFNERLTTWYGNEPSEMAVFWTTQIGAFAPFFWTMVFCNFILPFPFLAIRKLRTITGCVIASCGVVVGMWLERFLIIVPGLSHKPLPYSWGTYTPRWPEITIMVGSFAAMILLYTLFSKVVPIISIWELKVGEHYEHQAAKALGAAEEAGGDRMKAIYGLYSSPIEAQRAVDSLRRAGIKDREITILSSEPLEEYEFAQRDRDSYMTWIAGLGGLIGMTTGYLLTSVTQKLWAINTGGMPIVTNWTNLIVIFELTMLGGVFASVITLLITARIPGRAVIPYDPEISDGKILIGIANPRQDSVSNLERALRTPESAEIRTLQ